MRTVKSGILTSLIITIVKQWEWWEKYDLTFKGSRQHTGWWPLTIKVVAGICSPQKKLSCSQVPAKRNYMPPGSVKGGARGGKTVASKYHHHY